MPPKTIRLFMWGYQPHFRSLFEHLMADVMNALGVPESGVECLLVGALKTGRQNRHAVCVEPEDGKWNVDLFDRLLDLIEEEVETHPSRNIFYSDAPTMQEKPEEYPSRLGAHSRSEEAETLRLRQQGPLVRRTASTSWRLLRCTGVATSDGNFPTFPSTSRTDQVQYFCRSPEPCSRSRVRSPGRGTPMSCSGPIQGDNLIGRTKSPEEIIGRAGVFFHAYAWNSDRRQELWEPQSV